MSFDLRSFACWAIGFASRSPATRSLEFGGGPCRRYVKSLSWGDLPATSVTGWSKERLAKAAVTKASRSSFSFIDPTHLVDQKVIIDIGPTKRTSSRRAAFCGSSRPWSTLTLGGQYPSPPEQVRGLVQMVGLVLVGDVDAAVQIARDYMDFPSGDAVELFRSALKNRVEQTPARPVESQAKSRDQREAFGDVELKGASRLSPLLEIFATMIGMKRHPGPKLRNHTSHQGPRALRRLVAIGGRAQARLAWHVREGILNARERLSGNDKLIN